MIGVGTYKFILGADVPQTVEDASQLKGVLIDARLCGYQPENVSLLSGQSATRQGILESLKNLADDTEPEQTVTIFYAGHGDYDASGSYHLTCHDTRLEGGKVQPGTGISEFELLEALRAIQARRLVMIFNACHAGELAPSLELAGGETLGVSLPDAAAYAILASGEGRVIITACRASQRSYLGKGKTTLFGRAVIDGLSGMAGRNQNFISAYGLYEYVYLTVREQAEDIKRVQEPELTVLKGVGPFPLALYRGASELGGFDEAEALLVETALRQVTEKASKRQFDKIIQTGGGDFVSGKQNKAVIGSVSGGAVVHVGDVVYEALDPAVVKERQHKQAREAYLHALRAACDALPLAALGEDEAGTDEITLEQVYIDLDTTTRVEVKKERKKSKKGEETRGRLDLSEGREEDRAVTALEAAGQEKNLVLLGDPGSGKSTFVHHLLNWQTAACLGGTPVQGIDAGLTPVLITLRQLAPRLEDWSGLPARERQGKLLGALHAQIEAELKALGSAALEYLPHLLAELDAYACLLAFDGLDEVPEGKREAVRELVLAANQHHAAARRIITCRVRSYQGKAVFAGFHAHTLAPFDDKQIARFAEAWYNTQHKLHKIADPELAKARGADLARAAVVLRELASNPMLLTSMALIHQREVTLPDQRVKLYALVVEILIRRWQKQRAGEEPPGSVLGEFLKNDRRLYAALEHLAYEAHRTSANDSANDADNEGGGGELERLAAVCILDTPEHLGSLAAAGEFLDYADQRAGLLVGRGGEPGRPATYGFPHRSIQEYLAGCHIFGQRDLRKAVYAHAGEGEGWDLAAQLGMEEWYHNRRTENPLFDLIYALCPDCALETPQQQRAALWAGQMAALLGAGALEADTSGPLAGKIQLERLRRQLLAVMAGGLPALERAEAGRALAKLGDQRFRADAFYLPDEPLLGFVHIPAGPFIMGSDPQKDQYAQKNEQPQHPVELGEYYMARWPVTAGQYRTFVAVSGYETSDRSSLRGVDNHPVIYVTWYDAMAYCAWLTRGLKESDQTPEVLRGLLAQGWQVTIPSEAEWEKAARGGNGWVYPWGEAFDSARANTRESGFGGTSPLGCFPNGASPYGLEEMSGNVWEWTRSLWGEDWQKTDRTYPYQPGEAKYEDLSAPASTHRVLRGGAWDYDEFSARCASRSRYLPNYRSSGLGFRVVLCPSLPSVL